MYHISKNQMFACFYYEVIVIEVIEACYCRQVLCECSKGDFLKHDACL